MTHDELLEKVDEATYRLSFWIPRITIPENKEHWIEYKWNLVHGYKKALNGDFPEWEATQERLDAIDKSLNRIIESMPPIRYGHPAEIATEPTLVHGASCFCNWCEERKEGWSNDIR